MRRWIMRGWDWWLPNTKADHWSWLEEMTKVRFLWSAASIYCRPRHTAVSQMRYLFYVKIVYMYCKNLVSDVVCQEHSIWCRNYLEFIFEKFISKHGCTYLCLPDNESYSDYRSRWSREADSKQDVFKVRSSNMPIWESNKWKRKIRKGILVVD